MELIQALERLSLEVRNQKIGQQQASGISNNGRPTANKSNHGDAPVHISGLNSISELDCSNAHQPNDDLTALRCPSAASLRQLDEFDNSINTLLAQISDLDYPQDSHKLVANTQQEPYNFIAHDDPNAILRRGSLDTSSEEHSDESSQRSSNTNETINSQPDDPIVSYFFSKTRDLASITDKVKKITQILAIGSEIETLYQILSGIESIYSPRRQALNASSHVDSLYTRSLCDAFVGLCTSEPEITRLPTIIRYNDIRLKLMSQLDQSGVALQDPQHDKNFLCYSSRDNSRPTMNPMSGEDCAMEESDNENDESDLATLYAEQKNLDEWTENKLYIDNPSR